MKVAPLEVSYYDKWDENHAELRKMKGLLKRRLSIDDHHVEVESDPRNGRRKNTIIMD